MTSMILSPTELTEMYERLWQDAALIDSEWGDNQGCDVRQAADALLAMQSRIGELEEALGEKGSSMTEQSEALVVEIASILDHPSIYMGGPSRQSMMKARAILPILQAREAAAKADAKRLAEALERSQLGLTVLANMLKRVGLERGEQVAVEMHRDNTDALATYREKSRG